jgi:ribonuclease PH
LTARQDAMIAPTAVLYVACAFRMSEHLRADGRLSDQLRPVRFQNHIAPHAAGSTLIEWGDTRVICAATVEETVPKWMKDQKVPGGWISAEYSMLPYSTLDRKARDISKLKLDGRSQEIQRLIGRSLRAVIDLERLGPRTLWIDCDVLQADGGTRTASITGAFVAVSLAVKKLQAAGKITASPLNGAVAAVSVGVFGGVPLLDLNYLEDKDASVDMNLVMNNRGEFIELQAAGEEATFSDAELASLLSLGRKGIGELLKLQQEAIGS